MGLLQREQTAICTASMKELLTDEHRKEEDTGRTNKGGEGIVREAEYDEIFKGTRLFVRACSNAATKTSVERQKHIFHARTRATRPIIMSPIKS